jgi:hypothetical protein
MTYEEEVKLHVFLRGDGRERKSLCKQCYIELHLGTHSEETTGDKNFKFLPPVVY